MLPREASVGIDEGGMTSTSRNNRVGSTRGARGIRAPHAPFGTILDGRSVQGNWTDTNSHTLVVRSTFFGISIHTGYPTTAVRFAYVHHRSSASCAPEKTMTP